MMRSLSLVAATTAFISSTFTTTTLASTIQVSTASNGLVVGHTAPNRSTTYEFLGLQYGVAPVGDLRFAPTQRYYAPQSNSSSSGESAVFNASTWAPDCLANGPPYSTFPNFTETGFRVHSLFAAHTGNPQSEDCLYLNVWTKGVNSKNGTGRPVLVWFHGGRFQIPGPHSPFYNGQYLADAEDVVVVTSSYRLGIFRFSGAPSLPQNAALHDHRTVVEWVRDNIASFGGDPSRVIIFGQSAGGSAVDYYSYAWKQDPIVAGLISHSGTALSFLPNTKEYAQQLFFNVSAAVGCGGADDAGNVEEVVKCTRGVNASRVLAAAAKVPALPSLMLSQATFHPTIDEELVFSNYDAKSKAGDFARLPYLLGNTDYECGWYKLSAYAAKKNFTEEQWELFNQRGFTCPTGEEARQRVNYGVPTWRYRYFGDWTNLRLYNASAGLGRGSEAYHGSDTSIVFGTSQDVSGRRNSKEEDDMSRYMMGAWAAFARDPAKGLTEYGWPAYREDEETLVRLAFNISCKPDWVIPVMYDAACPEVNDPLPGQGAF